VLAKAAGDALSERRIRVHSLLYFPLTETVARWQWQETKPSGRSIRYSDGV